MEADSAIFIIVGVLAIMVVMVPVIGMLEGFGGTGFGEHSDRADVRSLASLIDEQCDSLDDFDNILVQSVDVDVFENDEIDFDGNEFLPSEDDWSVELNTECSVDLMEEDGEGNTMPIDSISEGSWEAVVGENNGGLEVVLEP